MNLYDAIWLCLTLNECVWLCVWPGQVWFCMTMYDYVWLCATINKYAWLCKTLLWLYYDSLQLCLNTYEYLWICMTLCDSVWLYMNMYDFENISNLFDFVWLTQLCTNFVLVQIRFLRCNCESEPVDLSTVNPIIRKKNFPRIKGSDIVLKLWAPKLNPLKNEKTTFFLFYIQKGMGIRVANIYFCIFSIFNPP